MVSKHKKMDNFSPVVILVLTLTTSILSQQITDLNTLATSTLNNIDLPLNDAKSLCQTLHESRIQSTNTFLWMAVNSTEKSEMEQQTLSPDCFNVKYVQCKGESRFPLSSKCGFFTLVPDKDCSSTGTRRSRRSTPTKQITLSHSEAVQLCTSIQNVPEEPLPLKVQFVSIPISLTGEEKSATLGDECVRWTNEACDNTGNEDKTADCSLWKFILHTTEKCAHLSKFQKMSNSSIIAKLPNPMHHKTDLLHSKDTKPEDRAFGADIFADVVECNSEGGTVNCKITPKTQRSRSKRAAHEQPTPISRVKRQCCGPYLCYNCYPSSHPRQNCDCSQFDPDNACENLGLCDTHEYPSGCYGDCSING